MYNILVVDDHPDQVEAVAMHLAALQLDTDHIYKAYDGVEALEIVRAIPIDLLITDIRMPEVDGIQLVAEVRTLSKKTRCILLTGYAEFDYAQKALQYQVSRYLMKPLDEEEFRENVQELLAEIAAEWEEKASQRRSLYSLKEHLPKLRDELLNRMIEGRGPSGAGLSRKLELLELPYRPGDQVSMLLVWMKGSRSDEDERDRSLLQYAVTNIAEDLFGDRFELWYCKDTFEYLVFLAKPRQSGCDAQGKQDLLTELEKCAAALQNNISHYLKRDAAVIVVKKWGVFPDVTGLYGIGTSAIRNHVGEESGSLFVTATDPVPHRLKGTFESLYRSPSLNHLFETGQWSQAEQRIGEIMTELKGKWSLSSEYGREAFHVIMSAFYYIVHKIDSNLEDIIGDHQTKLQDGTFFPGIGPYSDWIMEVFRAVRRKFEQSAADRRHSVIERIEQVVTHHLKDDISLQTISRYVDLHPAYISRLYKAETGISLSDYIQNYRMKLAIELLKQKKLKVCDICTELGYQTPHYFIKVFKGVYGMTPQDYRKHVLAVDVEEE